MFLRYTAYIGIPCTRKPRCVCFKAPSGEDSKRINQTEITLERKATDYSQIQKYALDFNPFYQVWAIVLASVLFSQSSLPYLPCIICELAVEVYAFQEDQTRFRLGAISDNDALRRKLIQTYQVLEKARARAPFL